MNRGDAVKLARIFREDMKLVDFQPMETTVGGKIIIFRTATEDDNQFVEGYYDIRDDELVFTIKEVDDPSTIDNIDASMRLTICDFKNHLMNKNYTPLDLQTLSDLEDVKIKYEIHGDQFLQYVCILLEQGYGEARTMKFLEMELEDRIRK